MKPDAAALIERVLNGEERAARALYDAHADRVYRLAYRLTGEEELARECTQQAFCRAFLRLGTFRGEAAFGTWLYRVTVNMTMGRLRQVGRSRQMEQELDPAAVAGVPPRDHDPMLRARLQEALAALPEPFRLVVVMHDVEGFTHEEIGRVLGIAAGTSKARLSRARARLRPLLAGCAREYAA
jgi:RNA polymerase sigma-70 factor, ECF subfamily